MNAGSAIGIFLLSFVGTAILGLLSKWIDRKVTARVQWRVGPPWYQAFADIVKLLGKETIVPEGARRSGFLLWPLAGLAAVTLASAILWTVNIFPGTSFNGDLIVVWYLLTIPSLSVILGASASGNPHGAVGASREMKLILAYELPFMLAILCVVFGATYAGGSVTFRLGEIIGAEMVGVLPAIACVIGFVIALLCIQAKLGLVPFDMPEAETEIMGGVYVEYSGAALAVLQLTRAMMLAALPVFAITVFWGGIAFSGLGILWAILKYVLILVVVVLIRNTNPRLRIDHALKFFWFGATPVAVVAVILAMIPK